MDGFKVMKSWYEKVARSLEEYDNMCFSLALLLRKVHA